MISFISDGRCRRIRIVVSFIEWYKAYVFQCKPFRAVFCKANGDRTYAPLR
jgi:hypothetical protein